VVPRNAIVTIDPLACERRQLVARPGATITALSVESDGSIYWAESYYALTVSRIFTMPPQGTGFSQILEVPGIVQKLRTDATYLYWLTEYSKQLLRAAKPPR
jgi:hypothetical protein